MARPWTRSTKISLTVWGSWSVLLQVAARSAATYVFVLRSVRGPRRNAPGRRRPGCRSNAPRPTGVLIKWGHQPGHRGATRRGGRAGSSWDGRRLLRSLSGSSASPRPRSGLAMDMGRRRASGVLRRARRLALGLRVQRPSTSRPRVPTTRHRRGPPGAQPVGPSRSTA